MAKKKLLAQNMKRPNLKREMKVTEANVNAVVQKVADNPPQAKPKAAGTAKRSTASSTSLAPAAAPKVASAPAAQPKRGRGRPRKEEAIARSPKSVHPKEGTKRLTLDIPQTLHKELKLLAIHQEISMKDYIIQVVQRSLK